MAMTDLVMIKTAIEGLKLTSDAFRYLRKVSTESEVIDKINSAVKQVNDAQEAFFNIRETLFTLQEENHALKQSLADVEKWESMLAAYEVVVTEGEGLVFKSKESPLRYACPSCIQIKSIQFLQDKKSPDGSFVCDGCKNSYYINPKKTYRPLNPKTIF
ncbi:MAG: hypothetical protein HRU04_18425 [Oceanospirillaceae bacterium]|nr:hypothetical protein [Oceanospirillaceae bacterium]